MDTHRYIARFIMEAETPLFVGSGVASLLKDALVQKDTNGFPMIQGTSLAGVLRHALTKVNPTLVNSLFGSDNSNNAQGSLLKVSSAYMMLDEKKVSEGILNSIDEKTFNRFSNLPSRQHVRITDKGVAQKNGLFDNEVVFKGTRFMFELELRGDNEDEAHWKQIIELVKSPTFRIGSGTRNGYGSLKVFSIFNQSFDLENKANFDAYIAFDPSFNSDLKFNEMAETNVKATGFTKFRLELEPDSFFIFSEGFGDDEADNRPLEEEVVVYKDKKIDFEKQTVIPASSIKGAISHRVAFHYNKLTKQFADENKSTVGIDNVAVSELFGQAGQNSKKELVDSQAGKVFINDFYFTDKEIVNNKIFNHVAIDRFTGGAMDGALFSEKVSNLLVNEFSFDVFVEDDNTINKTVIQALENTLSDICKGLLPLGGMTTKGHGMFTGSLSKNGEELFNYKTAQLCQA
jgi:CRISPR/Cas system CSM-associated protein Csm3 (group 7 of RAMP superfamily)